MLLNYEKVYIPDFTTLCYSEDQITLYSPRRTINLFFIQDVMEKNFIQPYFYIYIDTDKLLEYHLKHKYIPFLFRISSKLLYNDQLNLIYNFYKIEYYDNNFKLLFPNNISLYKFQIHNIQWMKNIESKVTDNTHVMKYNNNIILNDDYCYDPLRNYIGHNNYCNIKLKGGLLLDEVGLGKTISMISLCLENSNKSTNHSFNTCQAKIKSGLHKGNLCNNKLKNHMYYCNKHSNIKTIIRNNKLSITNCNGKKFIQTKSNLVVCPSHLCKQWEEEILKVSSELNVIVISIYQQYKKYTYNDIINADFIIISYTFLLNPSYTNYLFTYTCPSRYTRYSKQYTEFNNIKNNYLDNITIETHQEINALPLFLHFIKFKRIIYDEIHEVPCLDHKILYHISLLNSEFVWGLTGTPQIRDINTYMFLLMDQTINFDIYNDKFNFYKYFLESSCTFNSIINNTYISLYRRNTFIDIQNEIKLPGINHIIKLLDFSSDEREIYESEAIDSTELQLRQLCCHPILVDNFKFNEADSISDIKNSIINKYTNIITENNIQYLSTERLIRSLANADDFNTNIITDEIRKLESSLSSITTSNKLLRKRIEYLNVTYDNNSKENFSCNICFTDNEEDPLFQLLVISCGHNLCKSCMRTYMKKTTNEVKCPTCKQLIDLDTCYTLTKQNTNELHELIDKHGTKIASIISYIKSLNNNDKVIIFTEWEHMMYITGNILNSIGIKVKYCKGSVFQRNKIIKDFKKGVFNVLFLSIKNSASGSNLTEANHIIFLEPVYGTPDYIKATETQAIARAERIGQNKIVSVVKFIIKDTIEHDILKKNTLISH